VDQNPGVDTLFSTKFSTGIIVLGCVTLFCALCTLPAAFEKHGDTAVVGIAAALFSLGALTIAAGIYLKARVLQATLAGLPSAPSAAAPRRGGCELCGNEAPVVKCKVHQLNLCATCLSRHYDQRSCSYVPTSYGSSVKTGRAMAKSRGF
jgi:hypothetical protein